MMLLVSCRLPPFLKSMLRLLSRVLVIVGAVLRIAEEKVVEDRRPRTPQVRVHPRFPLLLELRLLNTLPPGLRQKGMILFGALVLVGLTLILPRTVSLSVLVVRLFPH
jgi:hypothetical protein